MGKILLITNEFPPDRGGVARYLGGVYSRMDAASWERLDPGTRPRWWQIFVRLLHLSRHAAIREIHCSHVFPVGTACYLLWCVRGIPYRVYVHGMDVAIASAGRGKRWLLRRILSHAFEVVANSEYSASLVHAVSPAAAVRVQYPKIDPPDSNTVALRASWRARHGLSDAFLLLCVARLVRRKGIDLVLLALRALPAGVRVLIIGTGPEETYLRELAVTGGVSDRVLFLGAVPDDELQAWYASADCFVLPVRGSGIDVEGFGMVYQEAAAHALVSIATATGGVPESVVHEQTGLLVPVEDVPALVQAIMRLVDDPLLRRRLGAAALMRCRDMFMWHV